MKNSNDKTAKYYDVISRFTKNRDVTTQEIDLIRNFVDQDSVVLEIGSGTGRHAIFVSEIVAELNCIDSSEAMIEIHKKKIAESKSDNTRIINNNFLEYENSEWTSKFNFIYLMWNTFNEVVLTEEDCVRFFQQCKKFIIPGGKILINIDDSTSVDPSNFDFEYEITDNEQEIKYSMKTSEYNDSTNTSKTLETIQVDEEISKTIITQRYWNPEQIMELAQSNGFEFMRNEKIRGNGELYLIFRG